MTALNPYANVTNQLHPNSIPHPVMTKPTTSRNLQLHTTSPHDTKSPTTQATIQNQLDLTQIEWTNYFDQRKLIRIPTNHYQPQAKEQSTEPNQTSINEFCIYTAAPPALASLASPPFLLVLIHGGGQSSLAWALVAGLLKASMSILAIDLRGHGGTHTTNDGDLSMTRLVEDVTQVIQFLYPKPPPLLLVGHSLGGALAVHITAIKRLPVAGLVVVDLVEGSAVSSLTHMSSILESRPSEFATPEEAIHWSLISGAIRNPESARVSVPDQLVRMEKSADSSTITTSAISTTSLSSSPTHHYRWRTDLLASQSYWSDWFAGLSNLFLSCPIPKLLILAASDRLDTPLMIAHMQGKLQLEILPDTGHSVQEDQPKHTARKLLEFVARHKLHAMASVWCQQARTNNSSTTPSTPIESPPSTSATASSKPPVPKFHD